VDLKAARHATCKRMKIEGQGWDVALPSKYEVLGSIPRIAKI
jgi:hypothetical protein